MIPYKIWFIYMGMFGAMTFISLISDAQVSVGGTSDINNAITFEVDKIGSGSGFLGLVRTSVSFFTSTLPKIITFNYSYLQGDLGIVRQFLQLTFGGTFMIMFGTSVMGLLRRNV